MTTPCSVKLASPCNCTHITLSPNLQSSGEFFRSAYCFARVLPRATGLMACGENFKLNLDLFSTKKVGNLPRCEWFGRRDTLMGKMLRHMKVKVKQLKKNSQLCWTSWTENRGRRHQQEGDTYPNDLTRRLLHLNHQEVPSPLWSYGIGLQASTGEEP